MKRVLILVLAMFLGCDKGSKPEPSASQPSPPTAPPASTPSGAMPTDANARGAASASTDGTMTVAAFFEGASPAEVNLGKVMGSGPRMAIPDGWKGDDTLHAGMVIARHPSGAKVMHYYVGPGKVTDKNRDFWVRGPLEATHVFWEEDVESRFGKAAIPGTAARGTGKSGKSDTDFYSFRYSTGGHAYLIVAALPKGVDSAVRQQAIAAARSGTFN